jgi:hypothetical protein
MRIANEFAERPSISARKALQHQCRMVPQIGEN